MGGEGDSTRSTDYYEYDSSVSSTTYDNRFAITQVDGALDDVAAGDCWVKRRCNKSNRKRRVKSVWSESDEEE